MQKWRKPHFAIKAFMQDVFNLDAMLFDEFICFFFLKNILCLVFKLVDTLFEYVMFGI